MKRYIDADQLLDEVQTESGCIDFSMTATDIRKMIREQPTADVVEVGEWYHLCGYILEMQADENGHNEFFRIIKLDDELKERIANEIDKAILYGAERR